MSSTIDIDNQLSQIDDRLTALEQEKAELLAKRHQLIESREKVFAASFNRFASEEAKVALFLSYFKGRPDVYPKRWTNREGKSGYSPHCANFWVGGVCLKRDAVPGKCKDCNHQAHVPYDEATIYSHLRGEIVAGIYPLLPDNKTHLLAFDFDKEDWFATVVALCGACDSFNIPYLVERSRSGNGGHVWLFFEEAIEASMVRKLGMGLLNKAMELYPELSFECFDRIFPNQDIMPQGGFGNLIALPLQKEARMLGNSSFIHPDGIRCADQWAKLASTARLSLDFVDELISKLDVDFGVASEPAEKGLKPWEHNAASRSKGLDDKIEGCPAEIIITLADQIYIPIDQLPGKLTSTLKHLAVFSNPEFYKKQALGFSTNGISKLVWSSHIEGNFLHLPRGVFAAVKTLIEQQEIAMTIQDNRESGDKLVGIKFTGKLKSEQSKAVNTLKEDFNGVLEAATGFGKTVVALALIAKRKVSTLILVHNKNLAEQWQQRAAVFLTGVNVGFLFGGKNKLSGEVDIATYQSLVGKHDKEINPAFYNYGQIIVDECHHLSAATYTHLLNSTEATYIHGITATPKRADGLEKLMHYQLGPVVYKAKSAAKSFEQVAIIKDTATSFDSAWSDPATKPHISEVYKHLYTDQNRNQLICSDICEAVQADHSVMVLTERKEHITLLAELLGEQNIEVVELHGSIAAKKRKERIEYIQTNEGKRFVILATGKYVGEGFDLPYLDTLFITLPIAWRGILAQYAGRIQREWSSKKQIRVFDYVDELPMLKRMWAKREKGYKALGYSLT